MRLRITSGIYGGRFIEAPQSDLTRPTTGRVKESVFNYLTNRMSFDDITVLDLYSGSGSLGLEALSRGAAKIIFVEKNLSPFKVLQKNISSLEADGNCTIMKTSAVAYVKVCESGAFDLILADPPFFSYDIYEVWTTVIEKQLLKPGSYFIVERSIQTLEKDVAGFGLEPNRRLGDTCLYEYQRSE